MGVDQPLLVPIPPYVQPIGYLGRGQPDALDQGFLTELNKHFQLTELVPPHWMQSGSKWPVALWSNGGAVPALPGDLLATSGFDMQLPWTKTWAYPTLDNPLHVTQRVLEGLARCKRVVCPTEALAELLADGLRYRPGVIRPGVPAGRSLDTQRSEYGREELRQVLWHDVQDSQLLIVADWLAGADELLAAIAQIDRPLRLVFRESGPIYQAPLDQLLELNNLGMAAQLTPRKGWVSDQLLFNAADLYIPACGWSSDIELAMACGCIPAVPDIDFWSERVDQQRGIELPTYLYVGDEGQPTFRYDPHGVAQLINGLTDKELRQRRRNGLAWAQDPANSWERKVAQWQQVFSR